MAMMRAILFSREACSAVESLGGRRWVFVIVSSALVMPWEQRSLTVPRAPKERV